MVLTPWRWCLLLMSGCAVVGVAYLPPADIMDSSRLARYVWSSLRENSRTRLAFAAERWAALSERDALSNVPATSDIPVLTIRSGIRPDVGQAVDSLIRNIWRRAPRADSTIRLRVVASGFDQPLDLWTAANVPEVLLPEQTDGHTCLVIIPGIFRQGDQAGWWNDLRRPVGRAVAPCVLRAVLGPPGPEIAHWLRTRGYDLGASIDWAVGGNAGVDYQSFSEYRLDPDSAGMPWLTRRLSGELPDAYQSTLAARCAGGVVGGCADLVLAAAVRQPGSGPAIRMRTPEQRRASGLPSDADSFLSDLILDKGLESFRRFWTSALPVNAAFTSAYGTSLDDWTRGWVRQRVGAVELGAPLHPVGALAGLLAGLLVVGVTAAAAASREIG